MNKKHLKIIIFSTLVLILLAPILLLVADKAIVYELSPLNNEAISGSHSLAMQEAGQLLDELHDQIELDPIDNFSSTSCSRGQFNWKKTDPYRERCMMRFGYFYGYNGDPAILMPKLDSALTELGWVNHYDVYYEENSQWWRPSGDLASGRLSTIRGYMKNNFWISINYAEKSQPTTYSVSSGAAYLRYYESNDFRQLSAAIIDEHDYIISISLEKEFYYKKRIIKSYF